MRRKITLPVPKVINEILIRDSKHFEISKEKLCNKIIIKMGYRTLSSYHKMMRYEKKSRLQFNLQLESEKYYSDISKVNHSITDSELMRSIFSTYINMTPFLREKLIQDSKIRLIEEVIKDRELIKWDDGSSIQEGYIDEIIRCPETNYLKVILSNGEEYLSKLSIVKVGVR